MTRYALAAAFIAMIGLLVFGYAREYVPTGHELILEAPLELERIDQIVERLETQPGVRSIEMRLVGEGAEDSGALFGEIRYEGFTIWLESETAEQGQTLTALSYRRRYMGRQAPEAVEAALNGLQDAIAAASESPVSVTRPHASIRPDP